MPAALFIRRGDYTAADFRREAKRTDDAHVARRMLALALVLEGKSRGEAARSCRMDRQILCDWVHRYNAEGLKGPGNRAAPGAKPKLSPEQQREVGRAGSPRAGFGRAWCGAPAADRPVNHA
jgi:hypothetical protein